MVDEEYIETRNDVTNSDVIKKYIEAQGNKEEKEYIRK